MKPFSQASCEFSTRKMVKQTKVFIEPPSPKLHDAYRILFNEEVKSFLYELFTEFETDINEVCILNLNSCKLVR